MSKTIQNGSFKDPLGVAVASGTLVLELSQDAKETAGGQVAPTLVEVALDVNGDVDGVVTILANDELEPAGTLYRATVLDSNGARVYGPQDWSISGNSPIDLDAMVPTISQVSAVSPVVASRQILTTGPLTGGGDLSVDRTIAITPAVAAKGDLYTGSAADAFSKLTLGTNESMLIADSSKAGGVRWGRLNNIAATVAPTVNEDSGDGYEVGSLWVDVTADIAYVALDVTVAAAVWQAIGGGGNSFAVLMPTAGLTAPVDGDFAWINQDNATKSVDGDGNIFIINPSTSGGASLRKKAAPGTPYTIEAGIIPFIPGTSGSQCGLCFRESSTGKLVIIGAHRDRGMSVAKYTNGDTFNGHYLELDTVAHGPVMWLRMTDNATNLIFSVSFDGRNYIQVHSVSRTDWMAGGPNEVGFFVAKSASPSIDAALTLIHWLES